MCCDFVPPPISLRILKLRVKVSRHQQLGALELLLERGNDTLYRRGVIKGKETSDNIPPLLPRHQLEADDFGPKLLNGLHHEMR